MAAIESALDVREPKSGKKDVTVLKAGVKIRNSEEFLKENGRGKKK